MIAVGVKKTDIDVARDAVTGRTWEDEQQRLFTGGGRLKETIRRWIVMRDKMMCDSDGITK